MTVVRTAYLDGLKFARELVASSITIQDATTMIDHIIQQLETKTEE